MKIKILACFILVTSILVAQEQSCCSPTVAFAKLSEDENFKSKHELKEFSAEERLGVYKEIPIEGQNPARVYIVNSKNESNDYLFVFHEWWGLNPHIEGEADKWFQKLEDVNVIAIDLYDGEMATTREQASALMQGVEKERAFSIIKAVQEFSGEDSKIATIGWCFGGGWSLQSAIAENENVQGCVIFYGMPEKDVERLKQLNCSVLGIFATEDNWINKKVVGDYEKAMKEADKNFENHWFKAEHAFANPSSNRFNKKEAQKANELAFDYLQSVFK